MGKLGDLGSAVMVLAAISFFFNLCCAFAFFSFLKSRGGFSYVLLRLKLKQPEIKKQSKSNWYLETVEQMRLLPIGPDDIVMLADSLVEQCRWNEFFPSRSVKNRGIGGDKTIDLLQRLDPIVAGKPAKIFIMAGLNDLLNADLPVSLVLQQYRRILERIRQESPLTKIVIQSVLPVFDEFRLVKIKALNSGLADLAQSEGCGFVDLYPLFCNEAGRMDVKDTWDGLHLTASAYLKWKAAIQSEVVAN